MKNPLDKISPGPLWKGKTFREAVERSIGVRDIWLIEEPIVAVSTRLLEDDNIIGMKYYLAGADGNRVRKTRIEPEVRDYYISLKKQTAEQTA